MSGEAPHPAKYHPDVLQLIAHTLLTEAERRGEKLRVLDPFAGTGLIHTLCDTLCPQAVAETVGVELEPEWAGYDSRTVVGSALALPDDWAGTFDVVATSPCYGNRMADHHEAKDGCRECGGEGTRQRLATPAEVDAGCELGVAYDPCSTCGGSGTTKRHTYRHYLGRSLSEGSTAALQWGPAYRELHDLAWAEALRVLRPGGLVLLNVKNHYRGSRLQRVVEYHLSSWLYLGASLVAARQVPARGNSHGANGGLRVDHEMVLALRVPA